MGGDIFIDDALFDPRPKDSGRHSVDSLLAVAYQVAIVCAFIFMGVVGHRLAQYYNQRAWLFADLTVVGVCIAGGVLAAAAIHATFFGDDIAADNIVFDITALMVIVGLLYIAGITAETLNLVVEAFIIIGTVVAVVALLMAVMLTASHGIARQAEY